MSQDNAPQEPQERAEYRTELRAAVLTTLCFMEDMIGAFPSQDPAGDNYSLMLRAFYCAQHEHGIAVLKLEMIKDSELIARTMLEGLGFLSHANEHRDSIPLRWVEYQPVSRFKLALAIHQYGKEDLSTNIESLREALKDIGRQFYSRKAKEADAAGKQLPDDPYTDSWSKHSSSELIVGVATPGKESILRQFYRTTSEYHHWNVGSLLKGFKLHDMKDGNYRAEFTGFTPEAYEQVLIVTSMCLHLTIKLCHEYWSLPINKQLEELQEVLMHSLGYTMQEVEEMTAHLVEPNITV